MNCTSVTRPISSTVHTTMADVLQPRMAPGETLTATELQILRLICADKSNAQIGEIMDIKLPTVKTHVSHILEKLGVSRRSEARTVAQKRWLV